MLGIVGGVGPFAGIDLFKKITELTPAATDQDHLPVIVFSFPGRIKDRTAYLQGEIAENPGIELAAICRDLHAAGATVAGIPCNTAHTPAIFHCILEELKHARCPLILVNMIDETLSEIRRTMLPNSRIGILCTTGTYRHKTYYTPLCAAGYTPVIPDETMQQELVHASIYHPSYGIKTQRGTISPRARAQLYEVMDRFIDQGVDAILLGCTEIPLAVQGEEYHGARLIDPTAILAQAMIDQFLRGRRQ